LARINSPSGNPIFVLMQWVENIFLSIRAV